MPAVYIRQFLLMILLLFCPPLFAAVDSFAQSMRRSWSTEDGLPQISVTDITQDHLGFIWLTTEGGLVRFDGAHFKAFNVDTTPLLSNPLLQRLVVDRDNSIIFANTLKLMRLRNGEFTEIQYQHQSIEGVKDLAIAANGDVLIAAEDLYLMRDKHLEKISGFVGPAHALYVYGERVYVGGINQLAIYQQGQLTDVKLQWPRKDLTITDITVYQQQVYLATNQGLFKQETADTLVVDDWSTEFSHTEILKMHLDQWQNLWISTYEKLYRVHQGRIAEVISRDDEQSVQWVVSTFEDQDGSLWFGSKSGGITRLRQDITKNYGLAQGLTDPFVWSLLVVKEKQQQRLLVGHNQGVAELKAGQFHVITQSSSLANQIIYSMYQDSEGHLWLGTRAGLAKTLLADQQLTTLQNFPELANTQVNGIVEDANQHIWIASYDGLFVFANNTLVRISEDAGIKNRKVRFVFVDAQNQLWVGTEQGLYLKEGERFVLVGDQKLQSAHITFIGATMDQQHLLVGTFQSGFATISLNNSEQRLRWFSPEQGIPAKSALYMTSFNDTYLIANSDGIYTLSAEEIQGNKPLSPKIILHDKGASARVDSYRCCNGAGNSKGALWQQQVYLPTLSGVVSVDLPQLPVKTRLPRPVFDGLASKGKLYTATNNTLPAEARDWRIDFTAPIFHRASSLIFRYQLVGYDHTWQDANARRQAFYTNLPPGDYEFVVQSRFEGEQEWSFPLRVSIRLAAYWYEMLWVKFLLLIGVICLCYAAFLLRLKQLAHAKIKLESMVEARTIELALSNQRLADLNEKLEQASLTDALTGLHNRRYLHHWLAEHAERVSPSHSLQVILLDLDNFKHINDTHGHLVGDEILIAMARLLQDEIASTDHLVRWGGEEFLVIQEHASSAIDLVCRIQEKMASYPWPAQVQREQVISCSMGIVQHPPSHGLSWHWDSTLTLADKALYIVKTHGKAGWLQLHPTALAPTNLGEIIANYTEMQLIQSQWFECKASALVQTALNNAMLMSQPVKIPKDPSTDD